MAGQSGSGERRVDLDWIRIVAFGLLILYHIGMVFVPWYYHVKSTHIIAGLEPLMLALNPWRLCLLFFIAGAATRFMAADAASGTLLGRRSVRLLLPLMFGMIVIVPPQSYWELVSRNLYNGDFLAFYTADYFAFAAQFCRNGRCLVLPTWNHLWFVAYLWVYTVTLMIIAMLLPGGMRRAEPGLTRVLSGIWLLALPALLFALYRMFLFPLFPQTNALLGDWYNHALYFSMFALGFLIALSEPVWAAVVQLRWAALGIAIAVFASYFLLRALWPPGSTLPIVSQLYQRLAHGAYQWCCIVAVLGFGRHLITTQDSAARRYLTDAIFPYYIIHQTVIVGIAFYLRDKGLSALAEAAIIFVATVSICALSYEIVKRLLWLRPLFGLKYRTQRA